MKRFVLFLILFLNAIGAGLGPALTIRDVAFLQIPEGIKGEFTVATQTPTVETILLEGLPESPDALWSSWGDGCFATNGKYYTAIGDHRGKGGNSYVYEYDPRNRTLRKIVDVAQALKLKAGEYGHGKIHAPILEHNGALYFATYWGKQREVPEAYQKGYKGSLLFRYDLKTQKLEHLGAIALRKGLPGSAIDRSRNLMYFYGVEREKGDIVVYDLKNRRIKFVAGAEFTADHRAFLHARDGKLYFSDAKGRLSYYDPDNNAISTSPVHLPGTENRLRASAAASSRGIIYGMTRGGRLFAFDPAKQEIKDLGPNFLTGQYNAAMVLSRDEKYIYYAPGSHGTAVKARTPVIQYSVAKGTRKVIAFLHGPFAKEVGYNIAGNYNLQIDPEGSTLYGTFNGSRIVQGKDSQDFGLPALVVIQIPESERK